MKINKKIAIDFDGTIINHSLNAQKIIFTKWNVKIPLKKCNSDKLKKQISRYKYKKLQNELYQKISLKAPIMPEMKEVLKYLKKEKWQLYIISKRIKQNRKYAKQWIKTNLSDIIPDKNIFFTNSTLAKIKQAKKLQCAFFIDDQIKTIKYLPKNIIGIHFDKYKNCRQKNHLHVANWKQLIKIYEKYKK